MPLALMPKGVEHDLNQFFMDDGFELVPLALMPKGVEHLQRISNGVNADSAPRIDAERR